MRTLIVIIISVAFSMNALAHDSLPKADTILVSVNLPSENSSYRDLYENQKETNEKLVSLLSTSLTLIVGIIIAIIGTSIFYNYRFNRKEYELLTKENENSLNEIHNALITTTNSRIDKAIENIASENDKKFEQLNETYKTNYETIKESLKTIILHFRKDFDKQIEGISKQLDTNSKEIREFSESAKHDVQFNAKSLKKDILDLQGDIYMLKNWYSLALNTFVSQGLLCIELNEVWQLEYILGDIIDAMKNAIEKSDTITTENKNNIEKLLSQIPEYLGTEKEFIKSNYSKLGIKEIVLPKREVGYLSLRDLYRRKK